MRQCPSQSSTFWGTSACRSPSWASTFILERIARYIQLQQPNQVPTFKILFTATHRASFTFEFIFALRIASLSRLFLPPILILTSNKYLYFLHFNYQVEFRHSDYITPPFFESPAQIPTLRLLRPVHYIPSSTSLSAIPIPQVSSNHNPSPSLTHKHPSIFSIFNFLTDNHTHQPKLIMSQPNSAPDSPTHGCFRPVYPYHYRRQCFYGYSTGQPHG